MNDRINDNKKNIDLRYINAIYVILCAFYGINFYFNNLLGDHPLMEILLIMFPAGMALNFFWKKIIANQKIVYIIHMFQLTAILMVNDWYYTSLETNTAFIYVPLILCIIFIDKKLFRFFAATIVFYHGVEGIYHNFNIDRLLMMICSDIVFLIMLLYIFAKFNRSRIINNYHRNLLDASNKHISVVNNSLNKLLSALEFNPNSVLITDLEGNIEYVNRKFTDLTGYAYDEVIGRNASILSSGLHEDQFYNDMWSDINKGNTWVGEFINKKKDGSIYYESAKISPVYDHKNLLISFVSTKNDITYEKELTATLENFAKFDHLTGIYNRRIGYEMLTNLIDVSYKKTFPVTVVYIDLDGLKMVNDNFGHKQGDYMLKVTVDLLNEYVRDSDVFFRYGGDEFVMGFNNSTSEGVIKLMEVANQRLKDKFEKEEYAVRFSYGIYSYDGKEKGDIKFILDEADKRMYINKNKTKEIGFDNE